MVPGLLIGLEHLADSNFFFKRNELLDVSGNRVVGIFEFFESRHVVVGEAVDDAGTRKVKDDVRGKHWFGDAGA